MAFSSDSIARASVSTEVIQACASLNLVWMSFTRRPALPFGVIVGLTLGRNHDAVRRHHYQMQNAGDQPLLPTEDD